MDRYRALDLSIRRRHTELNARQAPQHLRRCGVDSCFLLQVALNMFRLIGAIGRHIVVAFNIAWGVFILASPAPS